MSDDDKVIAHITTPIKAGDLVCLFQGELGWELTLDINDDGVLVVKR